MLFPHGDNLQRFRDTVPFDEMEDRLAQYNLLRRAHYSEWEATYIITAETPKDKEGTRRLQPLDLNSDVWQQAIKKRRGDFLTEVNHRIKKGMNRRQAATSIMKDLQAWYSKDDKRTPYDEIEEISPRGTPKPDVDFYFTLDNTNRKQIKKTPWKQAMRSK